MKAEGGNNRWTFRARTRLLWANEHTRPAIQQVVSLNPGSSRNSGTKLSHILRATFSVEPCISVNFLMIVNVFLPLSAATHGPPAKAIPVHPGPAAAFGAV